MFHNLYVEPVNRDSVRVAACCQADTHIVPVKSFGFQTDSKLSQLRSLADCGERSPVCNKCWSIEDLGGRSRRHTVIEHSTDRDSTARLTSLDINITWACNLACIMCGPQWSSTWATELGYENHGRKELGRQDQNKNSWIDLIDFADIQRVHFNGGEPLLNHAHKNVMLKMQAQDSLSEAFVSYNTNGTQVPDQQTLDLWAQARLVKIYFSIDAVGPAFDYIRYPASWTAVQHNILHFLSCVPSNVMFGLNVTVGCYNVLELRSLWEWFENHFFTNREGDLNDFCWQPSNGFDPDCLGVSARHAALQLIQDLPVFADLVKKLEKPTSRRDIWIQHLDALDQRRGTNWRKTLRIATYY